MPKRNDILLLEDILISISRILDYTEQMEYEDL